MVNASQIKEHMEVKGADGAHVGTVDCLKGSDEIVLTRSDSPDGAHHHIIPLAWVDHAGSHVHLSKKASEVKAQWQHAA